MIWPSTIIGLIRTPQSSTATTLSGFHWPVPRSISTTHDVGAERVGHVRRVVVVDALEPGLHAVREVRVGGEGDVLDRLRPLRRALDEEAATLPLEVVRRALEQVSRELARPCRAACARSRRSRRRRPASSGSRTCRGRRACCRCRPPARSTSSDGMPSSSATICANVVSWPWPWVLDAELQDRLAGGVDAQLGGVEHPQAGDVVLLAGPCADHLGEGGEADAEQPALLARLLLLPAQLRVAELLEREVHRLPVVARVVDEAGGRRRTGTAPAG